MWHIIKYCFYSIIIACFKNSDSKELFLQNIICNFLNLYIFWKKICCPCSCSCNKKKKNEYIKLSDVDNEDFESLAGFGVETLEDANKVLGIYGLRI